MGYSNYQSPIEYKLINENLNIKFKSKYRFCHIHCYDISKFEEIFGSYIINIKKHYSVIITYSIGDNNDSIGGIDFDILDFTVLKVKNKGVDIGGKINMIKYLLSNNIDFHHILFLHSSYYSFYVDFHLFLQLIEYLLLKCDGQYVYDVCNHNYLYTKVYHVAIL